MADSFTREDNYTPYSLYVLELSRNIARDIHSKTESHKSRLQGH